MQRISSISSFAYSSRISSSVMPARSAPCSAGWVACFTFSFLQRFSNTRIPSPPSILVLPILIPLSSCHTAAEHLLRALGGPEHARKIVGGQEWWQVRGVKGVEGEWIVVKKDWEAREKEEREREKEREKIRKDKVKHG